MASKKAKMAYIKDDCTKVKGTKPTVYVPKLRETYREKGVRKVETLKALKSARVPEKAIMVVGETGTGKTTIINGMMNYMLGVEWEDDFRLKLIDEPETPEGQANSQTSLITAYTVHRRAGFKVPYTLKLIDTPGFGDTRGVKRDDEIRKQMQQFFKAKDGIDTLNAVGFVVQSTTSKLSITQRYIFESVLSMFGKDIQENIFLLCTHADAKTPKVLQAVKQAKIQYQKFFRFNHSALFEDNESGAVDEDISRFNQMFWKMGMESFGMFLWEMDKVEPKSLLLSAGVIKERSDLNTALEGIRENIELSVNTLQQLKNEEQVLKKCKSDMEKNKNYTYEDDMEVVEQIPTAYNRYAINCKKCNVTCQRNCKISPDDKKKVPFCIGEDGTCKRCPEKCLWAEHEIKSYELSFKVVKMKRTLGDLKRKYEEAMGKGLNSEELIAECKRRNKQVWQETLGYLYKATRCIERLDEIALRPSTLTVAEYVDGLIVMEEESAREGWQNRVEWLREVRAQAAAQAFGKRPLPAPRGPERMPELHVDVDGDHKSSGFFGFVKRLFTKSS